MLEQFKNVHEFNYSEAVKGLTIVMFGLFKKIAVADMLAILVNQVYNNCAEYSGGIIIFATILYAIQIYCDFSGYTDMAIGFARILGIRLIENFRTPYMSKSIAGFWRRWHISLSSWFRDYVYISLGGNRVSIFRLLLNTMVTFTLSGVWHGASINFVIWGALNGVFVCMHNIKKKILIGLGKQESTSCIRNSIKCVITFLLVAFTWIFFRANSFSDAIYILKQIFIVRNYSMDALQTMGYPFFYFVMIFITSVILIIIDIADCKERVEERLRKQNVLVRWSTYILMSILILICKVYTPDSQQFIYFQF